MSHRVGYNPAIELNRLSYHYPDGRCALKEISWQVQPDEIVGLIGPNGAGKSTLFLCLAGVLKPSAGEIRVAGLNPTLAADRKILPSQLGIIFQNPDDQLFCPTIGEDVAFGPLNLGLSLPEVQQRVQQSLEQVNLLGYENRVPFQISGGEKRRAALAGVLAMQPKILLLDEPTMFLDPRGRRELRDLLTKISGTKIIASHDLRFIHKLCTRITLLSEGKMVADGSPDILLDQDLLEYHGLEGLDA
ncbi:MAG: energy-coupling factor ABC transporter ATP-binding protein [Gemmataceae bacterium]|nr:energy-coupling factor ABC transporter ATP-binding protein [Gemmataceae bacterium]